VELTGNRLSIWLRDLSDGAAGVLGWLSAGGYRIENVSTEKPNLETVFLTLTGRSLRDS
jgi:ABC-2 type transport system ATP-binding protein